MLFFKRLKFINKSFTNYYFVLAHKLESTKHQNNILNEEAENRKSKQQLKNYLIMRTITFLVASVLLVGNFAKASEIIKIADERTMNRFSFDEPISFTERGIEFFVFLNGDFDFNTRPNDVHGTYQFKQAGKRNATIDNRNDGNFGVLIERDQFGRVRRVGNTFINYDNRDRVSRIGTVYMSYNRMALTQIGGMRIMYNRRGDIVDMIGEVKGFRNSGYAYTTYGTTNGYSYNNYYNNNGYYNTNYDNDNNYYYYRTDGTKAVVNNNDNNEEDKK